METSALTGLRAAFEGLASNATKLTDHDLSMLRAHVCAAVDEMKGVGVPSVGIIVVVNDLAAETRMYGETLLAQLVTWCVDRYYE